MLPAQDDFSSLGLAAGQDADIRLLDDYHMFTSVEVNATEALFCPVNFIPDEVYEMIRTWEQSYLKHQEIADHAVGSMHLESFNNTRSSGSEIESMRCIPANAPPPKRFYRTFWRSLTRRARAAQRKRIGNFDEVAMSCSDASDASGEGSSIFP
jgi:hypothetical protein